MSRPSWDDTFIEICRVIAKRSKDQSTQIGCVIVGPGKEIRSIGYNCFPRNINDEVASRQKRPIKYLWMCHAERNALYNAARMGTCLFDCVCYLPAHPCSDCARGLIQVGIREVVCASDVVPERFAENCAVASEMLAEADIVVRLANTNDALVLKVGEGWGECTKKM